MTGVTRIYLDTKYWLFFRDVYSGRPRGDSHQLLYEKILELVASGKVICPVTDNALYEVFHQSDFSTRLSTAKVMDQLSAGIALDETHQRVRIEIVHFLRSCHERDDGLHRLSDWVWTRACWTLGEMHPHSPNLPGEIQTRLQIGFCEEMAKRSIADLVTALASAPEAVPRSFLGNLSRKLTEGKLRHAGEIRSLKQAFMMEVAGVLDAYREDIAGALAYISRAEAVKPADVEKKIGEIVELFRTGRIGMSLPFFNTQAGLHSVFRWNRNQKFKANDWLDYSHAGAALPYFDLFLTEKVLASLVTSNSLRYDSLYDTKVFSDPAEALAALATI